MGRFNIKATPKATIGKITNCEKNPTKKSFGFLSILVKSFSVRPRPNPNIINANTIGAILVTISIFFLSMMLINRLLLLINYFYIHIKFLI